MLEIIVTALNWFHWLHSQTNCVTFQNLWGRVQSNVGRASEIFFISDIMHTWLQGLPINQITQVAAWNHFFNVYFQLFSTCFMRALFVYDSTPLHQNGIGMKEATDSEGYHCVGVEKTALLEHNFHTQKSPLTNAWQDSSCSSRSHKLGLFILCITALGSHFANL